MEIPGDLFAAGIIMEGFRGPLSSSGAARSGIDLIVRLGKSIPNAVNKHIGVRAGADIGDIHPGAKGKITDLTPHNIPGGPGPGDLERRGIPGKDGIAFGPANIRVGARGGILINFVGLSSIVVLYKGTFTALAAEVHTILNRMVPGEGSRISGLKFMLQGIQIHSAAKGIGIHIGDGRARGPSKVCAVAILRIITPITIKVIKRLSMSIRIGPVIVDNIKIQREAGNLFGSQVGRGTTIRELIV